MIGAHQLPNQRILRMVCVLVLINKDVPEPALIVVTHFGELPQQINGAHNDVIKVQGMGGRESLLIALKNPTNHDLVIIGTSTNQVVRWRHELIFEP